ncbi:hypothetical protein [Neisseria polysaccharea]|uniref:hypothetical protein n=1 Tax=Neisseria polysaccharea TaxID=489 RepID=UPI0027E1AC9A|nr:hypothetical protein [Neisseria polysaccharea]
MPPIRAKAAAALQQAALIGLQSVENLTTAVGADKVLKQVVKPGNSFKRMLDKDARGEAAKKDDPPKPNLLGNYSKLAIFSRDST